MRAPEALVQALEWLEVAVISNAESESDAALEAPSTDVPEQKLRRRKPRVSDTTPRERIVLELRS